MHKLFLCLRYLRKRRIAFFGIASVALCVALLIVTTSLFSGFIDSYLTHVRQIYGEIVLVVDEDKIADYNALVTHFEQLPEVKHAHAIVKTGALLYLGKGDVRAVELVGIDLAQHSKEEYFRKGLLQQGSKETDPAFTLSTTALQRARDYLAKRSLGDDHMPVGAVLGVGILADPNEVTDKYDREDIIRKIQDLKRPMVITTGKLSQGQEQASGEKAVLPEKVTRTCWPVDVIQTGMHDADTRYVYLPLDFVKEIIGTKGDDGQFRCRGQVQITTTDKKVKSWLLTKDDILNPTRWVVILRRSDDPFTQYLRSELSEKTLRRMGEYEEENPVSDELMESLIADLNLILQNNKMYDTDIVDSLYLSAEANEWIEKYETRGFWSRLRHSVFGDYQDINRILLEDAYPLEIKRKLVLRRIEQAWWDFARDHWEDRIPYAGIFVSTENPGVKAFTGEIRKQRMIIVSILGLIGLVAALLIFVILFMIVLQKRRDIGVLRSLGSSRSDVVLVFIGFGGGIGLVGSGIGLVLGIWATKNISLIESLLMKLFGFKIWKSGVYFFSEIPNTVDKNWAVIIVISGIVTAIFGALVPALRASRVQPVEALRYE